ncbi:ParB N-terminal domain-containing protein [Asaia bogorensis]|uniref:Peptide transporter n=1 Tax=Asaia bogorensis NBRC 16594 TaxID=1231624 RepID=A0AAN4R4R9_9PROT|nr:ParB N-terminal domain-containing protein [Asaia bogorensis]GBQ81233.1 chromosome partitioning nuclease protein ParB [Asaia bogorensis NBRC 16594]GEL54921.1 peptide transporter [Asaia bogorensis NBRC 16594]
MTMTNATPELRLVDPRTLVANDTNPRRSPASEEDDRRLALNIQIAGLIHPPLVREQEDGSLKIIAGSRRVRACIMAKLRKIHVHVSTGDEKLDMLIAGSENIIRQAMSEPDQWAFVVNLRKEKGLSDGQICKAMMVTPAYLKRLELLARLHPPILDAIALGYGPESNARAAIAKSSLEEQEAAWCEMWSDHVQDGADPTHYRMTQEEAQGFEWNELAHALSHTEFYARDARFGDDLAKEHGIVWEEDLFAPADQDNRYTRNALAFSAAQTAWIASILTEGKIQIDCSEWGTPLFPEGFRRSFYAETTEGQAFAVDPRTLLVKEWDYLSCEVSAPSSTSMAYTPAPVAKKERADISGTGNKMIGEIRTRALDEALDAQVADVDPWDLVGALLLALSNKNIRVDGDRSRDCAYANNARTRARSALFPEGVLIRDPDLLRQHAITVLKSISNCGIGFHTASGLSAQLLGVHFNADAYMPSLAFEEFLKTYSKPGITKAVQALGLAEQATGKLMRASLINHVGQGHWVPPEAGFAQAVDVWRAQAAEEARRLARWNDADTDDTDAEDEDPGEDVTGDDADAVVPEMIPPSDPVEDEAASIGIVPDRKTADPTLAALSTRLRDSFASTPAGRKHFDDHVDIICV